MKRRICLLLILSAAVGGIHAQEYDLDSISRCLDRCTWTYAKTMPQAPHEYIVRGKCALTDEEFLYIVHAQRDLGIHEVWGSYNFPYLYVGDYKYWTMGDTFDNTIILNRQNVALSTPSTWDAKRVVAEYVRLYDTIAKAKTEGMQAVGTAAGAEIERLAKAITLFTGLDGPQPIGLICSVFETPDSSLASSAVAPESVEKILTELRSAVHDDTLFAELADGFDIGRDRWTLFHTLLQYRIGCDRLLASPAMSSDGEMGQRMGTSALRGLYNPIMEYIDAKMDFVAGLLLGESFNRSLTEDEVKLLSE